MRRSSGIGLTMLLLLASPMAAPAQQYRLRLDTGVQSVSFRGVALDSIPVSSTVPGPGGGPQTPDGFSVRCDVGSTHCYFYRPGSVQSARPAVTSAAATVWGFGVAGLSFRADARLALDLGDAEVWPGTSPSLQLLEGYAEYAVRRYTGRLGRLVYTSRLGYTGFDGARVTARLAAGQLDVDGYLGWGLGRSSALPVTSEALNPLDDFQPRQRQLVAGAALGWNHRLGSVRLDYQRQVDTRSDYFVSERAALAGVVRLPYRLSLDLGSEYDIAMGTWGTADATLRYNQPGFDLSAGVLRYRPYFELWTIWGAFSPLGYRAIKGAVGWSPRAHISIRAQGSRVWFEETETETPLATVEDRGWRLNLGASYSPIPVLALNVQQDLEFGPGAAYTSLSGSITYLPITSLTLVLHGGRLNRPLEFRFDEATLHFVGLEADWRISDRLRGSLGATRYMEERDRPDAASFDWNQTRLVARMSVLLGWESNQVPLPRAIRPTRPTSSQ